MQMGNCAGAPEKKGGEPGGASKPAAGAKPAAGNAGAPAGQAKSAPPKGNEPPKKPGQAPATKTISNSVLGRDTGDVSDFFTLGRELGRGQFGITHLATDKQTGQQFACKSISKRKLTSREDVEDVRREVAIMHHLAGHRNIVTLKAAFEDRHSVHLVMELCAGGELFDRIIARGHYSERAAAELLRTVVEVVSHCHKNGVIHRDLKPENFLLASKKEDADLKATDFGLSVFFKHGEVFTDIVGSAYYVAPEVLRRNYGPEADVWSAGVILYILLCGVPPFWAETEQGIFDAVLRGQIDFSSDPWPKISDSAKELVRQMLRQNPKERLSALQVLEHPWVRGEEAPDNPLDQAVLKRLKNFSVMNKFKKMALKVVAHNLSEEELKGLKEMFHMIDRDGSGTITYAELKDGLQKMGSTLAESEVMQLMAATDIDGSGTIDYEEFVAATMQLNKLEADQNMFSAFGHFDTDGSGFITIDELRNVLVENNMGDGESIEEIIKEFDQDNDGRINYDEFVFMMRTGNPDGAGPLGVLVADYQAKQKEKGHTGGRHK
eukprot:jgi/Mesvir1/27615/Mv07348-RA.1